MFNIIKMVRLFLDLTRSSKMVNIFDLYCDRYGKNAVQSIQYFGSINPNMWGYQTKEKTKEKKMKDEELRKQINELIRDEIQDVINDYVDEKEESSKGFSGFC